MAKTGKKGIELARNGQFDCIVLDYAIQDISGDEIIREIREMKKPSVPVIVYSTKPFSPAELDRLRLETNFYILKEFNWIDHLLDETVSHLHINHKDLLPESRRIIENIHNKADLLIGKSILVVDDDVRNLFTLTTVLERYKINAVTAESGMEAISILHQNPHIDMVLMDIMMPEMDGYEATRKIREDQKNSTLPIIAVTAKAMKGDREKCIEAGASDYIIKPVKIDQLLSLIRLWFQ
jgi:CheY-like chemotaxis protein